MRKDWSKVLIERPRYGYAQPSPKTGRRIRHYDAEDEYDELPQRIGSSLKYLGGQKKFFTDMLNPLYGLLHKNLGRPWDAVYSEICAYLDRRKTTGAHVFEHLFSFVTVQCYYDEKGDLWGIGYYGQPKLLCELGGGFYVDPRTRLLCFYDKKNKRDARRKFEARKQQQRREVERKEISYDQSYVRINGVWYIGDYVVDDERPALELPPPINSYDTLEKRRKRVGEFGTHYWNGKRWMVLTSKRKCTQQELQQAGLRNATAR